MKGIRSLSRFIIFACGCLVLAPFVEKPILSHWIAFPLLPYNLLLAFFLGLRFRSGIADHVVKQEGWRGVKFPSPSWDNISVLLFDKIFPLESRPLWLIENILEGFPDGYSSSSPATALRGFFLSSSSDLEYLYHGQR